MLLGFAGVLVGLTVKDLRGTLATIGAALAGVAAVLAGAAFVPRSFPALKVGPLRRRHLASDEEFTRLTLLDTRIAMHHETLGHLRVKAVLVTAASMALGAAVVFTVLAGTRYAGALMSENAAITKATGQPTPPPFEPDAELIGHAEGNALEERLYRRAAEKMRREAEENAEHDR